MPCDDPAKSKFFTYFTQNFTRLQLAKLTAIHYTPGATSTLTTITYLLHHNPQQFKIIGFSSRLAQPTRVNGHKVTTDFVISNVRKYARVVIQARH
nr:MAG TPA: adenine-specific methyltransferase [Caudoviricetes sp.]